MKKKGKRDNLMGNREREREVIGWKGVNVASMCIYREPDSRVLIVESVMKKNQDQMSLYYQTTLFFEFRAIKGGLVG